MPTKLTKQGIRDLNDKPVNGKPKDGPAALKVVPRGAYDVCKHEWWPRSTGGFSCLHCLIWSEYER